MEAIISTPFLDRLFPAELINLSRCSKYIRNKCYDYLPIRIRAEFKYFGPSVGDLIRTYIFAATKAGKLVPGSEGFSSLDEVVFSAGCSNDQEMISYLLSNYDVLELTILSLATRGHNIGPLMEEGRFLWPFMRALEGITGEGDISDVYLYGGCRPLREYAIDVQNRNDDREMEDEIYGDWVERWLKGEV